MFKAFKQKITNICEETNMPDEVTEKILKEIITVDFSDIAIDFPNLLSIDTGGEAVKNIETKLKDSADSFKPLTVYLAAAVKTWEH